MKQAGNALFLILIAVALFAALSYAVTQSGRGGGSIDREKISLLTAEFTQWVSEVTFEIQRMSVLDNVSEDGFDFNSPGHGWVESCSDSSVCALFEQSSGGRVKNLSINDPLFWRVGGGCSGVPTYGIGPGSSALVRMIRFEGLGDPNLAEIVLEVRCLSDEVCLEYNRQIGLTSSTIPLDPYNSEDYNPSLNEPASSATSDIGDEISELADKKSFCLRNGSFSGQNTSFVQVLIVR